MQKTIATPELDSQIISFYQDGKSSYEIANIFHCAQSFIIKRLKKNNINRRSVSIANTKYIINDQFFEEINCEANAYFLGLMYADGNNYIGKNGKSYQIGISLQEEDKQILEIFQSYLCPNTKLKFRLRGKPHWKNQYGLKINSKLLSEQLINLGCIPNKSLKLIFPQFIFKDEKLLQHFMRGYFDGDGSIYCRKKNNNYGFTITSTYNFCIEFKKYIKYKLNIHGNLQMNKNKITHTLSIGGNQQVKKILDWLYTGSSIYLSRKFNKYLELNLLLQNQRH